MGTVAEGNLSALRELWRRVKVREEREQRDAGFAQHARDRFEYGWHAGRASFATQTLKLIEQVASEIRDQATKAHQR